MKDGSIIEERRTVCSVECILCGRRSPARASADDAVEAAIADGYEEVVEQLTRPAHHGPGDEPATVPPRLAGAPVCRGCRFNILNYGVTRRLETGPQRVRRLADLVDDEVAGEAAADLGRGDGAAARIKLAPLNRGYLERIAADPTTDPALAAEARAVIAARDEAPHAPALPEATNKCGPGGSLVWPGGIVGGTGGARCGRAGCLENAPAGEVFCPSCAARI